MFCGTQPSTAVLLWRRGTPIRNTPHVFSRRGRDGFLQLVIVCEQKDARCVEVQSTNWAEVGYPCRNGGERREAKRTGDTAIHRRLRVVRAHVNQQRLLQILNIREEGDGDRERRDMTTCSDNGLRFLILGTLPR